MVRYSLNEYQRFRPGVGWLSSPCLLQPFYMPHFPFTPIGEIACDQTTQQKIMFKNIVTRKKVKSERSCVLNYFCSQQSFLALIGDLPLSLAN